MIDIRLLNNNTIITLETKGKPAIKASSGMYFHNSMELLCVALGSCIGKHLVRYCALNKINIEMFESISVDMNNNKFIVHIQHPKTLTDEQKTEIESVVTNCDVGKMLSNEIEVTFSKNKVDPEPNRKRKPCCGG